MASEFTALFTAVKTAISVWALTPAATALLLNRKINVLNEYAPIAATFPTVTICEKGDRFNPNAHELDNYETFSTNTVEINVFDDAENRVEIVYALKDIINTAIIKYAPTHSPFRFSRVHSEPTLNISDNSIYRWLLRYQNNS